MVLGFSERLYKAMADVVVEEGYLEAGYEYVIVDDVWMDMSRDAQGRLAPDPHRFPGGINGLAQYVSCGSYLKSHYVHTTQFTSMKPLTVQ